MEGNTLSNSMQSSALIESLQPDCSAELSLDWEAFSFEAEIDTRADINKRNLKALKSMADLTSLKVEDDDIIKELQVNKNVYSKLLMNNTDVCSKYKDLMKECKRIKQNVEDLSAKNNSIEKLIKELGAEETNSRKEYIQLKAAYQVGLEMYCSNFDIEVTTHNLTETTYEASLRFGEKNVGPIKFIVNRTKRKVLDFRANEVLLPEEEEDIRNKFGTLENLPGLLCALREIILRK